MNIENFKYTKIVQEFTSSEKSEAQHNNRKKDKLDRTPTQDKHLRKIALTKIKKYIQILRLSDDPYEKLLGKQLALEKEYINAKHKRDLMILIESKTGMPAAGDYNLSEIGNVLGLTRERVRQIEGNVLKLLKHPMVGRNLRNAEVE